MTTTVHTGPFVFVLTDDDVEPLEVHFTLPSAIQGHAAIIEEEGIDWTPIDADLSLPLDSDERDLSAGSWVNEYDDCTIYRVPLKG